MTEREYHQAMGYYSIEIAQLQDRGGSVRFDDDGRDAGCAVIEDDNGLQLDLSTDAELGAFFVGVRVGAKSTRGRGFKQ